MRCLAPTAWLESAYYLRRSALGHDGLWIFANWILTDRILANRGLANRRRRRRRLLARQIGGGGSAQHGQGCSRTRPLQRSARSTASRSTTAISKASTSSCAIFALKPQRPRARFSREHRKRGVSGQSSKEGLKKGISPRVRRCAGSGPPRTAKILGLEVPPTLVVPENPIQRGFAR